MINKKHFLLCLVLIACMLFSLVACNNAGAGEETSSEDVESTSEEIISLESTDESTESDTESDSEADTTPDPMAGKILTSELPLYTIVRSNEATASVKDSAVRLKNYLSEKWDRSVQVRVDTIWDGVPQYSVQTNEILLGDTNREESDQFIAKLGKYDYGYAVINRKIVIAGKNTITLNMAIELFAENILNVKGFDTDIYLTAEECIIKEVDISDNREENENALKVMSFNVQVWDQSEERYEGVIDQIKANMPDSFGVQEADGKWMNVLSDRLKSSNYAYVGIGRENNSASEHSAVFYRSDKFELIDSGTRWLSETPDEPSKVESAGYRRIVTWATLRRISDGKIFIHANTHLDHKSSDARVAQVTNLLKILNTLPDYPIVLTGDFNAQSSESAFELITDAGYVNSASYKFEGDADSHPTYHGYTSAGSAIDFGFVRPEDFMVLYYHVCDELVPSDHYAIYFEFMFNE